MTEGTDKTDKPKLQWWNIVSKVRDEAAAIELVKLGGFVGGYLAVSGVILMIVVWFFPGVLNTVADERGYALFGYGFQTLLGLALGYLVWKTHSWWTVVPLGAWGVAEAAFKFVVVFSGGGAGGTIVGAIVLIAAIQMVRGRIMLSLIRKRATQSPTVTGAD
ncbi:MAG: hypothetical protein CMF74_06030 [Maricaulis sp.]|jgi:hypothetical protein|nr:hypothetical protein [Maricaulis sp.]HAQ35517.1 hypothetical protein [Alphaproteobacteria bacterium]|tara:strand:- start:116 stop:601 length:486 start_codon:yes stop_codon:yes gene_type:complete